MNAEYARKVRIIIRDKNPDAMFEYDISGVTMANLDIGSIKDIVSRLPDPLREIVECFAHFVLDPKTGDRLIP